MCCVMRVCVCVCVCVFVCVCVCVLFFYFIACTSKTGKNSDSERISVWSSELH